MKEPQSINIETLKSFIVDWLQRFDDPTTKPVLIPSGDLLHKLGRWAKAFAISFARERPTVGAISNAAGEYVAQHYRVMVPIREVKTAENDETIFSLSSGFITLLTKGATKESAFLVILADFEQHPGKYLRADDAAPIADLDDVWHRYAMFLR